jgi:hypothetical protein
LLLRSTEIQPLVHRLFHIEFLSIQLERPLSSLLLLSSPLSCFSLTPGCNIFSACRCVCKSFTCTQDWCKGRQGRGLRVKVFLFSLCGVWGVRCSLHLLSFPLLSFYMLCCGRRSVYINNTSFSLSGSSILHVFIAPGCRWKGG